MVISATGKNIALVSLIAHNIKREVLYLMDISMKISAKILS